MIGTAIFYTIVYVVAAVCLSYEVIDTMPLYKRDWKEGKRMGMINCIILSILFDVSCIYTIYIIWNSI